MINVYEVTNYFKGTQSGATVGIGDIVCLRYGGFELGEAEGWWGAEALEDAVDYTVAGIDKYGDLLIRPDKERWVSPLHYPRYLFTVVKHKSKVSIPKFKAGDTVVVTGEGHAKGVAASWYSAPALEIGSLHKLIGVGPHSVSIFLGNRPSLGLSYAYYNPEVFELVDGAKVVDYVSDKVLVRDHIIKQLEKENLALRAEVKALQESLLDASEKQKEDADAVYGLRLAVETALYHLENAPKL